MRAASVLAFVLGCSGARAPAAPPVAEPVIAAAAASDAHAQAHALVAAGLAAKARGDVVLARALFDRAVQALGFERTVDARNGLAGSARVARFTTDGSLVVAHGTLVSVFTALREARVLRGHRADVSSLAVSADGRTIASASIDRTLRLWDAATGKPLGTIVVPSDPTSLAYSPGGELAVGFADGSVEVFRGTKSVRTITEHLGGVTAVAWSPDGTLASASIDRTIRLHDASKVFATDASPHVIAFSPDGKLLAYGGPNPAVRVVDAKTGWPVATLSGHAERVLDLAFSRDGGTLASASVDETVRLWDVGGAFLCKKTLERHIAPVRAVTFDASGDHLASASDDRTVQIWDARSGAALTSIGAHADAATSVAISKAGDVAWGSTDGAVRILSGSRLSTVRGHVMQVTALAWSPDGVSLATGGDDDSVRVIREGVSTRLGAHKGSVTSVAWSPDGRLASGGRDGVLRVWDPKTTWKRGRSVESIAWSTDGALLASGGVDGTITLSTGITMRHFGEPILSLAFRDGSSFASGSLDGSIAIFSASGTRENVLEGHADGVTGLAWSRDRLVSSSLDGTALLWSVTGGAPLPLDHDLDDPVTGVAFSHDGAFLATSAADGAIRVFRRDGKLLVSARGLRDGSGYVFAPDGRYESLGEAPPPLRCAVGAELLPIDVCEARFATSGLLRSVLP